MTAMIPKLFPHQIEGVAWLQAHRTGLLADEMGLGKTAQILLAACENTDRPVLVVAPASVVGSWMQEAASWVPERKVVRVSRADFRVPEDGEIVVTSYDSLPPKGTEEKLVKYPCTTLRPYSVAIADEAHLLKNPNARRTEGFRAVGRGARRVTQGGTWLVTATPVQNNPAEMYRLFDVAFIAKDVFGSYESYCERMQCTFEEIYVKGGRGMTRTVAKFPPGAQENVIPYLKNHMLRRTREDVALNLPERRTEIVPVPINDAYARAAEAFGNELSKKRTSIEEIVADPDAKIEFTTLARLRAASASLKIPAMREIVDAYLDAGEPLVVASAHKGPIDVLTKMAMTDERVMTLTGDVPVEKRGPLVARFQASQGAAVMGLTIVAGGVGITLTRSSHMLFVDWMWNPSANAQCADRIYRIGQRRGCLYRHLVIDHEIDRHIHRVLTSKMMMIGAMGLQGTMQQW